jgi:hypothetical protein
MGPSNKSKPTIVKDDDDDEEHSPTSTPAPVPVEKKAEQPQAKTDNDSDDKARGRTLRPKTGDRAQERSVSPGTMPGKNLSFVAT